MDENQDEDQDQIGREIFFIKRKNLTKQRLTESGW